MNKIGQKEYSFEVHVHASSNNAKEKAQNKFNIAIFIVINHEIDTVGKYIVSKTYLRPQSEIYLGQPNRHNHSWVSSHIRSDTPECFRNYHYLTSLSKRNKNAGLIFQSNGVALWTSTLYLILISFCFDE